jgi:hypothetical protein
MMMCHTTADQRFHLWFILQYCHSLKEYTIKWQDNYHITNSRECTRKKTLPNLRYYPSISLEGLGGNKKNQSAYIQGSGQDSNPQNHCN